MDEANQKDDSTERMAYVLAFAVTPYAATINRLSKPFNPLLGKKEKKYNIFIEIIVVFINLNKHLSLKIYTVIVYLIIFRLILIGETFEFHNEKKNYYFFSEQVSHHPPISAGYCFNDNFESWANTMVKTTFKGQSIEVTPQGGVHIKLKKNKDHFIFFKVKNKSSTKLTIHIYIYYI